MKSSEKNPLNGNRKGHGRFCAPVQPWETRASAIVSRLARSGRVFSSDDVWALLARAGVDVPAGERRRMGHVIREAQACRVIRSAGIRKSARASRQQGYVTMWRAA